MPLNLMLFSVSSKYSYFVCNLSFLFSGFQRGYSACAQNYYYVTALSISWEWDHI